MKPENLQYIGSGFHWQSLAVDEKGRIWEGWFDTFTKRTNWRPKK